MGSVKRRICVFTGTRADYGLLRGLILTIEKSTEAELLLVVSGTHLVEDRGMTSVEISGDGLTPAAVIPIWSGLDDPVNAAADTGAAIGEFARALDRLEPDMVVVLGDRLEAFAMATAATVLSVPLVHIHGGELTEGAMDDALRHAITKFAYLHVTSTDEHKRRVIQLGEDPGRVFNLGAPIVDVVSDIELLSQNELTERFGVRFGSRTALMTFHPAVMDVRPAGELVGALLAALTDIDDLHVVITGTNSDIGAEEVRRLISEFVARNPDRVDYVESFGQVGYLSVMAHASVVIGNSSSTVLEAPIMGVPSVLVGDRQAGRPLSPSVIHPQPDRESIGNAIARALEGDFAAAARGTGATPFGSRGFARRTFELLMSEDIPRPPRKRFRDSAVELA